MVDFSGLYKNRKSCFFKLEAKILIICYRISSQVNLMSHTWETHHPGCRQHNRGWLLRGTGAARGKGKSCCTLCYVIIKPLNPSNWQLLSRTRGMVMLVGKHAAFLLPSFLYQEGFTAFAAGLEKGDRSGVAVGRCLLGSPTPCLSSESCDAGSVRGARESFCWGDLDQDCDQGLHERRGLFAGQLAVQTLCSALLGFHTSLAGCASQPASGGQATVVWASLDNRVWVSSLHAATSLGINTEYLCHKRSEIPALNISKN